MTMTPDESERLEYLEDLVANLGERMVRAEDLLYYLAMAAGRPGSVLRQNVMGMLPDVFARRDGLRERIEAARQAPLPTRPLEHAPNPA